jgi:hypothetical protein
MPKTRHVYPRHVQLLPINLPVENTVCRCTDVVTLIQHPYNLKSVFPRIVDPHNQVDDFVTKNEIEELRIFLGGC